MKIGNKIKSIRIHELNLSAHYVAEQLGMTTRAYSNIENNVSDISFSKLSKISEIFKVPIEYIINYDLGVPSYQNNFYNSNGGTFTSNISQGLNHNDLIELFNKFIGALAEFKNSK